MEQKKSILLKISLYTGLVPLIGGWLIFIIWLVARYLNAYDFISLALIGFFWMAICFWVALIGLLILFIYSIINRKKLHRNILYVALIILINVPSVILILSWHADLEKRVFVKLTNETGQDKIQLTLLGNTKSWDIGIIKNYIVFNYDPPFWNGDGRHYQKPDTLKLILRNNKIIDTVAFPTLRLGECKHLIIDKDYRIKN